MKAGTETDTTYYARVNPFLLFLFFPLHIHLLMEPLAKGPITNCSWCKGKLKLKYKGGFSRERCQLTKPTALVFAQTWKSQIKPQSLNSYNTAQGSTLRYLLDSASQLFRTDVLQLKLCLEISFIQQLPGSKNTAFSERCFPVQHLLPPLSQSTVKATLGLCCERRESWLPSVSCAAVGEGRSACAHRGAHELPWPKYKRQYDFLESTGVSSAQPVCFLGFYLCLCS